MSREPFALCLGGALCLALAWAGVGDAVLMPPGIRGAGYRDGGSPRKGPPKRIVSATIATDEILLALLPPAHILAVTTLADDPKISNVVEKAHTVPGRVRAEAEGIMSLMPDLVFVARYTRAEEVNLMEKAGVPIFRMPSYDSLSDVRRNIRLVGMAVGKEASARRIIKGMDETLKRVARLHAGKRPPRVLYYRLSGYTSGTGTIFDELLAVAGGRNAASEAGIIGHQRLPLETALALNPDVILLSGYTGNPKSRGASIETALMNDPVWKDVAAVRNGRVYTLPGNHLSCISHHVVKAAEDMAAVLHPESAKAAPGQ